MPITHEFFESRFHSLVRFFNNIIMKGNLTVTGVVTVTPPTSLLSGGNILVVNGNARVTGDLAVVGDVTSPFRNLDFYTVTSFGAVDLDAEVGTVASVGVGYTALASSGGGFALIVAGDTRWAYVALTDSE